MTELPRVSALRLPRARALLILAVALAIASLDLRTGTASGDGGLEQWPEGGHIRVLNPKDTSPDEAEKIYRVLLPRMIKGYLKSGLADLDYSAWRRLNTHPYISDQHGARFVNVYTNDKAENIVVASANNPMPVGAKIVKDSISAVESGGVARGPLFLMEKMPEGFAPELGDWRYTMVMPNGKLFGTTGGKGNAAVKFCAECHVQAADRDYLFEIPSEFLTDR